MLPPTVLDRQSVRIVHGRAKVIDAGAIDGREEEHAGEWCDADRDQLLARIEARLHLDGGWRAREHLIAIGTRHGWAIQERVDHDLRSSRSGLLDPETP